MEGLFLIVGLGNPGLEYCRTRHNAGFMAVAKFGHRHEVQWSLERRFQARLASGRWAGRKYLLCQPQTYMNISGVAVDALLEYFKIPESQILVAVDDADLPLGQIRLRAGGSSGGHHGLESIQKQIGTTEYARLRIGIGRQSSTGRQITNHVLGEFSAEEAGLFERVLARTADQIECWLAKGVKEAMNQFNGAVDAPTAKESK